ncbi:MAG TPA: DUF177 domain-containing protein [Polyangia bacterium]
MKFKVKDIGEQGVDVDLALSPAWLAQECGDLEPKPDDAGVTFKGRIEPAGATDYLLRGKLRGGLLVPCARCLETARLPLDVEVSVIYVPREQAPSDDEAVGEDQLDAPDVLPFDEGVIDLGPELRDEILLAVPVSVLCREDCAGLCFVCGNNRNVNPCDCVAREQKAHSKFAALAKLKTDS